MTIGELVEVQGPLVSVLKIIHEEPAHRLDKEQAIAVTKDLQGRVDLVKSRIATEARDHLGLERLPDVSPKWLAAAVERRRKAVKERGWEYP